MLALTAEWSSLCYCNVSFAFELAAPMLALINITAFRVADASLDRYDRIRQTELMDNSGKTVKLNNFDIDFKKSHSDTMNRLLSRI